MTSESPGDSDVVENNFLRNKNILKKEKIIMELKMESKF